MASGWLRSLLLRSDGSVAATDLLTPYRDESTPCQVPPLSGLTYYTQVAMGCRHMLLLRSDGRVDAFDDSRRPCDTGECNEACAVPALGPGQTYTQVAAGSSHSLLLCSDGTVLALGDNLDGQCDIPELGEDLKYVQVAAGSEHSVLLRSDGKVVACGANDEGQCDVPSSGGGLLDVFHDIPTPDVKYTEVAAGFHHTLLLRSDGEVDAYGDNRYGQCVIPHLPEGLTYVQVAGGCDHTLLLRSDATVVACGANDEGQCDIPTLSPDLRYIGVDGGFCHSLLLRSDGTVDAVGSNVYGQCNIPPLTAGLKYTKSFTPAVMLQASYEDEKMVLRLLSAEIAHEFYATPHTLLSELSDLLKRKQREMGCYKFDVIFPDGELLSQMLSCEPAATLRSALTWRDSHPEGSTHFEELTDFWPVLGASSGATKLAAKLR